MNWNPFKRKAKPVTDSVYVSVILDKPLQGLTVTEPDVKPWIKVTGIDLATAAQALPGKTIDWHTVPMVLRSKLELDDRCAEISIEQLQGFLK